jgi:hypothetical protein
MNNNHREKFNNKHKSFTNSTKHPKLQPIKMQTPQKLNIICAQNLISKEGTLLPFYGFLSHQNERKIG